MDDMIQVYCCRNEADDAVYPWSLVAFLDTSGGSVDSVVIKRFRTEENAARFLEGMWGGIKEKYRVR